jgi:hypothetical protein
LAYRVWPNAREGREVQGWQSTCLGAREVPRELSSFELQTFFTYSYAEHELIG